MHYIRALMSLLRDIFSNRVLLWQMTKRDFRQRYIASHLGILWAFIQPTVTVLVFWFVFELGFKSQPVDNFPFILWLVCGMVPWFCIADSMSGATNAIVESSFLVKQVVFRVELLPMVKLMSAFVVHAFFVAVLFLMFALYGYPVSFFNFQFLYYAAAMFCLCLGMSWITSALTVFLRDMSQLVGMLLQLAFWGTPIFWSLRMIPPQFHTVLQMNPAYYIIEGYRQSFIYHEWFWQNLPLTLYFWCFTIVMLFVGAFLFKRMRPHFADML